MSFARSLMPLPTMGLLSPKTASVYPLLVTLAAATGIRL
jgi:hypothetical protein